MTTAVKEATEAEVESKVEYRAEVLARHDVIIREKVVEVLADMPGVDKDSVEITLHRDVLEITGKRADYDGESRKDYKCSFTLGTQLDTKKIKATVKDGVLKVEIPKTADAGVKRIPIK